MSKTSPTAGHSPIQAPADFSASSAADWGAKLRLFLIYCVAGVGVFGASALFIKYGLVIFGQHKA